MTKKEIRKTKAITMRHFLEMYYGIEEDEAIKLSLHCHKNLKRICDMYGVIVSKMSFDNVTKEMLARGEVVLVEDIFRNVAPYINPNIDLTNEFETTMDEKYVSYEIYEGDEENDKCKGKRKVKCFKS